MEEKELQEYEDLLKYYRDLRNSLYTAEEKGRAQEHAEGLAQWESGRSMIRFCLGTAAGLRPAVTNVSPLERLQRSWEMMSKENNR